MNATDAPDQPKADSSVWGVLELMGHVRLAGRISEEEKFGAKLGRVDVPLKDGSFVTQYFGASSVYRLTIVAEDVARSVARNLVQPVPVSAWEYPKAIAAAGDGDRLDGAHAPAGPHDENEADEWPTDGDDF
jgi:hypothetical protein